MTDREKVARTNEPEAITRFRNIADAKTGEGRMFTLEDGAVIIAYIDQLKAMRGDGQRQDVHTTLLNAAHELRAAAPFIGGSGQVDMLAVADQCTTLTLPEFALGDGGIEPFAWAYEPANSRLNDPVCVTVRRPINPKWEIPLYT